MPSFVQDVRINQVQNDLRPEQETSVLEQALKISFNAWIRSMVTNVSNDCK
jgi:hypothetical protein